MSSLLVYVVHGISKKRDFDQPSWSQQLKYELLPGSEESIVETVKESSQIQFCLVFILIFYLILFVNKWCEWNLVVLLFVHIRPLIWHKLWWQLMDLEF